MIQIGNVPNNAPLNQILDHVNKILNQHEDSINSAKSSKIAGEASQDQLTVRNRLTIKNIRFGITDESSVANSTLFETSAGLLKYKNKYGIIKSLN